MVTYPQLLTRRTDSTITRTGILQSTFPPPTGLMRLRCDVSLQLGQGVLVQVSPSLVKRQKTHFHDLPCGASVILGNNGFIWIYPTPEHKEEDAGGFIANLEVRKHL